MSEPSSVSTQTSTSTLDSSSQVSTRNLVPTEATTTEATTTYTTFSTLAPPSNSTIDIVTVIPDASPTSGVTGPSPSPEPLPLENKGDCYRWPGGIPPDFNTTAEAALGTFNLEEFSKLTAALEAAAPSIPDNTQYGFNATNPGLFWIKERRDNCVAHLFNSETDPQGNTIQTDAFVSLCFPTSLLNNKPKAESRTQDLQMNPPLEKIASLLKSIESDLRAYQRNINGTTCVWKPTPPPTSTVTSSVEDSRFQVLNLGEYGVNNTRIPPMLQFKGLWYLKIGGNASMWLRDNLYWGANLKFDLPGWDLRDMNFVPSNEAETKSGGSCETTKMSAVKRTIGSLRLLAEDIYQTNVSNIWSIDRKDGDCVKHFCGGRTNLTVSLCGFRSFYDFDQLNEAGLYASRLNNVTKISEVVNFARLELEKAVDQSTKKSYVYDKNNKFGRTLRRFACASNSSRHDDMLPGIFKLDLERRGAKDIPICRGDGKISIKDPKNACGNFTLEISSRPCTILRGSCRIPANVPNQDPKELGARIGDIMKARDNIQLENVEPTFAQNLIGETPTEWIRYTSKDYQQYFCDYQNSVKVLVGKPGLNISQDRIDYPVPKKAIIRGLDLLIQELKQSDISNPDRITRSCNWGGPPPVRNSTSKETLYVGSVISWQRRNYQTVQPSEEPSWPWQFYVTGLKKDDPCSNFSTVAF
ncbi:hypothetical protein TWF281_011296 [Arthrobotrys megalospora]